MASSENDLSDGDDVGADNGVQIEHDDLSRGLESTVAHRGHAIHFLN